MLPTSPTDERRRRVRRASSTSASACVEVVARSGRSSRSPPGARSGARSTSTPRNAAPFIVAASGCAPPMPPEPAGHHQPPRERAAEVLPGALGEGLVGALQDPLGADVDPRPGGHLAVHREAQRLEPAELVPGRPARHQVRVGDQHPRRLVVRAEDADRLAALHQQRLVVLQPAQRGDDPLVGTPSCGRPCPLPP